MNQLTPNFTDAEPGLTCMQTAPPQVVANCVYLLANLVEPVRAYFGKPVNVHDSWRPPAENAQVGGVKTSYHLYTGTRAAVDFDVEGVPYQVVFDWIRLESGLGFDEVILESNEAGIPVCIHIQVDSALKPRRCALTGRANGASSVYVPQSVN